MYLQSHHLDLEYYDTLFQPGAYLRTHTEHLGRWHGVEEWDTYFVARGLHDRANTAHFARYYFFDAGRLLVGMSGL